MGPDIDIAVRHEAWADALGDEIDGIAARAVAAALDAAGHRHAPAADAELSIVLCDDGFIRSLNRQWRGKDKATNVLSFPAAPAARGHALGDVIVAFETSAGEAAERGMPLADYLTHLVVHGTFHLLGFDHEEEEAAAEMEGLESRALAGLGIASPFAGIDEDAAVLRTAP